MVILGSSGWGAGAVLDVFPGPTDRVRGDAVFGYFYHLGVVLPGAKTEEGDPAAAQRHERVQLPKGGDGVFVRRDMGVGHVRQLRPQA